MAKSSTSFKEGENGNGRGRSFKNKLLDAIKEESLLECDSKTDPREVEKKYLAHLSRRAFDPGDSASGTLLKELLHKSYPSIKAVMPEFQFDYKITESPVDQVNQIISASSKGEIPPDVASIFIQSIKAAHDIEATTELKERIEKLEAIINAG